MEPSISWMMGICSVLSCSSSFAMAFYKQLTEHAKSLSGLDLTDGNYSLVPPHQELNYHKSGVVFFRTDIVTKGMGYPVTIGWKCLNHPNEHIHPTDEIRSGCQIQIVWLEFPIKELKNNARSLDLHQHHFTFNIDYKDQTWPDVHMFMYSKSSYSADQIQTIDLLIDDSIQTWNTEHESEGLIHYRSDLRHIAPNILAIHIDFGSASREALIAILARISHINEQMMLTSITIH